MSRVVVTPWIAAALLAACTTKESDRESKQEPPGPRPVEEAAKDAAPPVDDEGVDGAFRAVATRAATRAGGEIAAWGTANLDDDPAPERFATVRPTDLIHDTGAYVLEDGDRRWLVRFQADGRTQMFGVEADDIVGSDARWKPRTDTAITHTQGHRGGYETIVFALRGGAPVVLRHEALEDARGGDEPVIADLAPGGVCETPCPPLATWIQGHDSSIVAVEELAPQP